MSTNNFSFFLDDDGHQMIAFHRYDNVIKIETIIIYWRCVYVYVFLCLLLFLFLLLFHRWTKNSNIHLFISRFISVITEIHPIFNVMRKQLLFFSLFLSFRNCIRCDSYGRIYWYNIIVLSLSVLIR